MPDSSEHAFLQKTIAAPKTVCLKIETCKDGGQQCCAPVGTLAYEPTRNRQRRRRCEVLHEFGVDTLELMQRCILSRNICNPPVLGECKRPQHPQKVSLTVAVVAVNKPHHSVTVSCDRIELLGGRFMPSLIPNV